MKQVIFYSKRVAAFALACFVVVFSIGFSSSAATVATDLHADINMNVEIKYTDGTFSQSDPELIGKTPFNVDPEDWAMAAPPVFSNKQISHVRVNTDLTGYQVPTTVIPPDPVNVIKAGTYRFNDVLTKSDIELNADINFTVAVTAYGSYVGTAHCDNITFTADTETYSRTYNTLRYNVAELVPPFEFLATPVQLLMYQTSVYDEIGGIWDTDIYSEGIKTITIPNDTEVSAEFLTWFTANTVQQKQISGKWKFKDVLTAPSLSSYAINFSISPSISMDTSTMSVVLVEGEIGFTEMYLSALGQFYVRNNDTNLPVWDATNRWNALASEFRNTGFSNAETLNGYGQTIDFGTEPQFVSPEFYNWLLANATPLDQVIPDDPEPETPAPVVGKTVQMRVLYRVELGLAKDAVSSISVNSGTRSGTVWTPLPYTTISSKYAMDTSTGSSYIDATIQFTLPADSEVLRVYGTFYTSPFTASNIGEVVGGVQVCEFLYLDPVTDQDPSDKVEVDRIDGVVSDKLDQTGQITDTIEQLQKPSVDVNGSGAPVIGGMVVDPMEQVDPENFGSYTSVIGAIFGSGTILGYFVIAFSMIFISYVIFGKSG